MHHILSFSFLTNENETAPPGRSIAEFLRRELATPGTSVGMPENYNDIGWSIDCTLGQERAWLYVGHLALPNAEWQLIVPSTEPWYRRMLGAPRTTAREQLVLGIHQAVSGDARFRDVRWSSRFHPSQSYPSSPTPGPA